MTKHSIHADQRRRKRLRWLRDVAYNASAPFLAMAIGWFFVVLLDYFEEPYVFFGPGKIAGYLLAHFHVVVIMEVVLVSAIAACFFAYRYAVRKLGSKEIERMTKIEADKEKARRRALEDEKAEQARKAMVRANKAAIKRRK